MNRIFYTLVFLTVSSVFIKNTLHMFQQNRYELLRYTKWLFSFKGKFEVKLVVIYFCLMIASLFIPNYYSHIVCIIISIIFGIIFINVEDNKIYIKPLVYTPRVKRTLILFVIVVGVVEFLLVDPLKDHLGILGILSVIFPYILIYPVALVLKPFELLIKQKYINEAKNILKANPDLIKVGITGSYGKTTTKNIVSRILDSKYYTLMTPASFNTPMGITRTIREDLKRVHEIFVCEMGADHVGDITYLMKMVKPKYGIVSSIGPQHLNTFGKLDNIINEKMQEIELLPEDGVGIINVDNEYIAKYPIKNVCKIVSVGYNNQNADYVAKKVKISIDGTSFTCKTNGKDYSFKTKLLGEHNITNILLGIALATELGIEPKKIKEAVEILEQVEHRLEAKVINGYNFIDDAFNSNPSGCMFALKTLSLMPGKRVIVTPGLIDLGEIENRTNYDFGKNMLGKVDFVILVGKNQTRFIHKGLKDSGYDMNKVLVVDKVVDAFNYVYNNFTPSDTILLENDLPDAFNN